MAEGFARAYGNDVLIPASAGFTPAVTVPAQTLKAMNEKNLDISAHFPKSISQLSRVDFDLIVNMSGIPLPADNGTPVRDWAVPDPVALDYEEHCKVRDQIETLVMGLILDLRREAKRCVKKH